MAEALVSMAEVTAGRLLLGLQRDETGLGRGSPHASGINTEEQEAKI